MPPEKESCVRSTLELQLSTLRPRVLEDAEARRTLSKTADYRRQGATVPPNQPQCSDIDGAHDRQVRERNRGLDVIP